MILLTAVSQKHQIPTNNFYERCTTLPHCKLQITTEKLKIYIRKVIFHLN